MEETGKIRRLARVPCHITLHIRALSVLSLPVLPVKYCLKH